MIYGHSLRLAKEALPQHRSRLPLGLRGGEHGRGPKQVEGDGHHGGRGVVHNFAADAYGVVLLRALHGLLAVLLGGLQVVIVGRLLQALGACGKGQTVESVQLG